MTVGVFVPSVCLSIGKSCQGRDYSELGNIRNWVEHSIFTLGVNLKTVCRIKNPEQKSVNCCRKQTVPISICLCQVYTKALSLGLISF